MANPLKSLSSHGSVSASVDSLASIPGIRELSVTNELPSGSPHSLNSTSASSLSSSGSIPTHHQHHPFGDAASLLHRSHVDSMRSPSQSQSHSRNHSNHSQHSPASLTRAFAESSISNSNNSTTNGGSNRPDFSSLASSALTNATLVPNTQGSGDLPTLHDMADNRGPGSPGQQPLSTWTSPTMRPRGYPSVSTSVSSGGGLTSPLSLSSPVHLSQPQPKTKKDKHSFGGMSASSFLTETLPATGMKLYPGSKRGAKSQGDMFNNNNNNGGSSSSKGKKNGPLSSINTRKQQLSPGHHTIERTYSSSTSNISSPMTPEHKAHLTHANHHYMSSPTLSRNNHSSLDAKVMAREMSHGHATEDVWQALCIKVLTLFNGQGLTGAIEDLNDLVRRCLATRSPIALCGEINELLKNGMLTLNAKLGDVPDEKLVSRLVEVWSFFFGTVLPYFEGVFLPLQIELKTDQQPRRLQRKVSPSSTLISTSLATSSSSMSGGGNSVNGFHFQGGLESSMMGGASPKALGGGLDKEEDVEPENVRTMALRSFRDLVILPMVDRLGDVFTKLFMDFDASIPVNDTASRMVQMTSILTSIQSGDGQQLLMEQVSNRLKTNWKQFTRRGNRGGFAGLEKKIAPLPSPVQAQSQTQTQAPVQAPH